MFADFFVEGLQAQVGALAALLIQKGILTQEEWQSAIKEMAQLMQSQEFRDARMAEAIKQDREAQAT